MADNRPPETAAPGGLLTGLLRALGVLLGLHLQQAQQEASSDAGRLIGGLLLLAAGAFFALLALAVGEAAAVWALHRYLRLDWIWALLVVAGSNLGLALLLVLGARAKLRKPLLQQTRQLLRRTVTGLIDS